MRAIPKNVMTGGKEVTGRWTCWHILGCWWPFRRQVAWKITRYLWVMRFWMLYLIHLCGQHSWIGEKVVVCSKKKKASEGEEDDKHQSHMCQQKQCLHRDIIRVAICCLFLMHVRVQQGCGNSSQHRVLHEALLEWYSFKDSAYPSFQERCADCVTFKARFITRAYTLLS